jgi:undecaprenyl-diphosphatase
VIPTVVQAAVLGVVQGLLEFLPVSSTAHLLIGARLLGFDDPGGVFTVMIQLGSILALMWLYRAKIFSVVTGLTTERDARHFALMLIVAFIPAVVAGAFLAKYVQNVLYESMTVIAIAFVAGGIVMLIVERVRPQPVVFDAGKTPIGRALGIGASQMLALVPGVSRSGSTIVGGMVAGLDRPAAAEFSFFLAMPTMAAAFAKQVIDVRHHLAPERGLEIAVGFVMAFIASLVIVRPFLALVRRVGFAPFAWYRIVAGAVLLLAVSRGWL